MGDTIRPFKVSSDPQGTDWNPPGVQAQWVAPAGLEQIEQMRVKSGTTRRSFAGWKAFIQTF